MYQFSFGAGCCKMSNTKPYEELAQLLASAYTTGDKDSIRRINWTRGTSFVWDHEPVKMQQRLVNWFASSERTGELALLDARNMVARLYGFANWVKLQAGIMQQPADPRSVKEYRSVAPPYFMINWKENSLSVPGPQPESDWEKIFDIIREYSLTALNASEIPDSVMQKLPTQLTKLGSGGLTDEGMLQLERMPQLEHLDLGNWHSAITDHGLQVLRHLKNLRHFDMVWAQRITDKGISNLAGCDKLERVNLHGTNTGDGVLKALAGKHKLTHLTAGMTVTDAGIEHLHQFPVFKEWQGGEADFHLLSYQANPNHLMIGGTYTDKGLARLNGLNGLFGLTFLGNKSQFSPKGLSSLGSLLHLGFFSLDGEHCTDKAMEAIAGLPHLRMLLAQGAVAGDDGFASLAKSSSIEYIWGRESPNFGSKGFKALSAMPSLRGLAVSCKFVDDEALASLPHFPSLRQLMPMDVGDAGFRHVGACEQLEKLWCMYCRDTTDAATEQIARLKKLQFYYAGQTLITNRSLEILGSMDSMEDLQFWNISGITQAGVNALTRLPQLKKVSFDGCINITLDAVSVFNPGVEVHYSG
jgi:hypothetical protein